MPSIRRKLGARTVLNLKPDPDGKDVFFWDTQIPGFGVRLKPSGAASWFYQYRNKFGRTRRFRIAKSRSKKLRFIGKWLGWSIA
jgi:hypothetical protein